MVRSSNLDWEWRSLCHCSALTLTPAGRCWRILGEKCSPTFAVAREVAEETARETLIEALKSGDTVPDCVQVTGHEGHEAATISPDGLLHR